MRSLAALGLLAAASCSGSSSSEFAGDLFIESCSLACTDGDGGSQVFCAIVNVTENQEVAVLFSEPIDPASVNSSSLQVIDVNNGTTPDGLRFVDPLDPRRVIFRPAVSFETGVDFSFLRNRSYEVRIPGEAQGDAGPFIRSIEGRPNQSRLLCTILTSGGVADVVPGDPIVEVSVDVVTSLDAMGEVLTTERQVIGADVATAVSNVARTSKVYFEFNELMFLPTVASNQFGTAPFIRVELDRDGNVATTAGGDRQELAGVYSVSVDQLTLTTQLEFDPAALIPSAGDAPSLLVVRIPTMVTDIVGNPVTSATGGGVLVAIPEVLNFDPISLPDEDGENFDVPAGTTGSLEDSTGSGAVWANSRLSPGLTGGTGRHGALRIGSGETLVIDTDSQTFPVGLNELNIIGNRDPITGDYPRTLTVTDGVFEFSTLQISPNGRLVLKGSNPARLLVRGQCVVSPGGIIDASGQSAPAHSSLVADNDDLFAALNAGLGANEVPFLAGGPNGATGGLGGDRADLDGTSLIGLGGGEFGAIANPGSERNGRPGGGVGGTSIGRGNGGAQFPVNLPMTPGTQAANLMDLAFSFQPDPLSGTATDECVVYQIAGVGSGGGFATGGGAGIANPVAPQTDEPVTTIAAGQTNSVGTGALGLAAPDVNNTNYDVRLLRWQNGDLQGGASGGGGGNHPFGTESSGAPMIGEGCASEIPIGGADMTRWMDHSAGSGGGGGGAVEVLAGRTIDLDGIVDASGGNGGSALTVATTANSFAMPGGAGSGGAIRLRSQFVDIGPSAIIDARGGDGGSAPWTQFGAGISTVGGAGGFGLIRVEDGATGAISFAGVAPNVPPFDSMNVEDSAVWLSVGPGFVDESTVGLLRPDSVSGSASCWIRPPGAFQTLGFEADTGPTVEEQGWTMDVVLDDGAGGTTLRPFRGTNATFGTSWEDSFGNLLGYDLAMGETASPIVVRFQGAVSVGTSLPNPCNIDINAPSALGGLIVDGTLTPWVAHPADLELLQDAVGNSFSPTMVRYIVIFDRTDDGGTDRPGQTLISEGVLGVDNVLIKADPN